MGVEYHQPRVRCNRVGNFEIHRPSSSCCWAYGRLVADRVGVKFGSPKFEE